MAVKKTVKLVKSSKAKGAIKKKPTRPPLKSKSAGKKSRVKTLIKKKPVVRNPNPKRPKKIGPVVAALKDNASARDMAMQAAAVCAEKKASDIVVYDVQGKTGYTDFVVVASADSDRLVEALAESIEQKFKPTGIRPMSIEGSDGGNWVLMDYSDVVIHLFHVDARHFYDLDGFWADVPKQRVAA